MSRISKQNLSGRVVPWTRTIMGQPYSKANSRKLTHVRGKTRFIKSDQALSYLKSFAIQCPTLDPMFMGDVHVELEIYYASRRPDLDESLILDALQGRVYRNDRQVRKKTVTGGVDQERPRTVIRVSPLIGIQRTWTFRNSGMPVGPQYSSELGNTSMSMNGLQYWPAPQCPNSP